MIKIFKKTDKQGRDFLLDIMRRVHNEKAIENMVKSTSTYSSNKRKIDSVLKEFDRYGGSDKGKLYPDSVIKKYIDIYNSVEDGGHKDLKTKIDAMSNSDVFVGTVKSPKIKLLELPAHSNDEDDGYKYIASNLKNECIDKLEILKPKFDNEMFELTYDTGFHFMVFIEKKK